MAYYRLVAIDRREARDGKPVEILGTFNPRKMKTPESFHADRVHHWISKGALPTDSVLYALKNAGLWEQVKPGSAVPVPAPQSA